MTAWSRAVRIAKVALPPFVPPPGFFGRITGAANLAYQSVLRM